MRLVSYRTRQAFAGEPGRANNLGIAVWDGVVPASSYGPQIAASASSTV